MKSEKILRKRVRLTPEARRRELVDAGIRCIQQYGIVGFTIEKIAEMAGVSMGLVSHYFDGRNGLLAAVYEHLLASITRLTPGAGSSLSESIHAVVAVIENNFRNEVYDRMNFQVWLQLYAEMGFNRELQARQAELARDYTARLAEYLASIAGHRSLTLDAPAVALDFVAFLDGLWLQWCLGNSNDTSVEKARAYAFLEHHVGPLNKPSVM